MVDDEAQVRLGSDDGQRRWQLARANQQVIGERGGLHGAQPTTDATTQQPLGVGFVVDLVADADQPVATRCGAHRRDGFGDIRRSRVDPNR